MITALIVTLTACYVVNALFVGAWAWFCLIFWAPPTNQQILSRIAIPFWWLFKEPKL